MSNGAYVVEDAEGVALLEISPQDLEIVFVGEEDRFFEEPFGQATVLYTSQNGRDWSRVTTEGALPDRFSAFIGAPVGDGVALLGWDQLGEGQQLWIGSPPA